MDYRVGHYRACKIGSPQYCTANNAQPGLSDPIIRVHGFELLAVHSLPCNPGWAISGCVNNARPDKARPVLYDPIIRIHYVHGLSAVHSWLCNIGSYNIWTLKYYLDYRKKKLTM